MDEKIMEHIVLGVQYREIRRFILLLFVCPLLLLIAFLPIAPKASAAVLVPISIQVEYFNPLYCGHHPSCCPIITNFPWGEVSGGVSSDPEVSCMNLMEGENDFRQCSWNASGYEGVAPHLHDGIYVSTGTFPSCGLTKSNPDGTISYQSTYRNLTVSCPVGYTESGSLCVLTGVNPGKNDNFCPVDSYRPSPIDTAFGYNQQSETDYSSSGTSAPLNFRRFYSSSTHWEDSDFGSNWRHTYARRISLNSTAEISIATVFRPNGDFFYFTAQADGSWLGDFDVTARLTRLNDAGGEPAGWEYIDSSNNVEHYDTTGKLITITNLAGQILTLGYNSSDRLVNVTDSSGRSINFAYDGMDRITQMVDPSGGVYGYTYGAENNLVQVTRSDQTTRQYHYNEQQYTSSTNLQHALTGITDENGDRYAIYQYDASGRAVSSEHAGGAKRHSFSFNADGTTTVTNPLGKQTTYHFTTIEGVKRVTQVEGHPTASCEGASKAYSYNANGFLISKTDWNGNTTTYIRDGRGLELSRTEASGTAEARTVTTEWHPQFRLPMRRTESNKITEYTYDAQGRQLSRSVRSVQ